MKVQRHVLLRSVLRRLEEVDLLLNDAAHVTGAPLSRGRRLYRSMKIVYDPLNNAFAG
jgi:hypothetical protein